MGGDYSTLHIPLADWQTDKYSVFVLHLVLCLLNEPPPSSIMATVILLLIIIIINIRYWSLKRARLWRDRIAWVREPIVFSNIYNCITNPLYYSFHPSIPPPHHSCIQFKATSINLRHYNVCMFLQLLRPIQQQPTKVRPRSQPQMSRLNQFV